MNNDYLTQLTPSQRRAVEYKDGPMMIVAGAGTGKTAVITTKIAYLIDQQVKPENILALTFTEKAAREMQERVDLLVPLGIFDATISTFHQFCREILNRFSTQANLNSESKLFSELEQKLIIKQNIDQFPAGSLRPLTNPFIKIDAMLTFFSRCKDELISAEKLDHLLKENQIKDPELIDLSQAYIVYQRLLLEQNGLDFGDLILRTFEMLKNQPKVLDQLRQQYQHILVDEYQDTNHAQVELIKLLAPQNHHITVVGDDDQSIYQFRGAAFGQMEQFRQHYQNCQIITLNDNFRSPQIILDQAYRVIQNNNPHRLEFTAKINKRLKAHIKTQSDFLEARTFATDNDEASWIANDILKKLNGENFEDFCILVRSNSQARIFAEKLLERQIPFITKNDAGLLDDQVVKQIVNFCQVVADPHQFLPFFFLATSKIYQVPAEDLIFALSETKSTHTPIETVIAQSDKLNPVCEKLLSDIKWARAQLATLKTSELVLAWYKRRPEFINLGQDLGDTNSAVVGLLNFMKAVQNFESISSDNKLLHFIENLDTVLADNLSDEVLNSGGVRLLTIHLAKGTEYKYVYISNLCEGRFPSTRISNGFALPNFIKMPEPENSHVEEERRLFYVALTRAKVGAILTHAKIYQNGSRERKPSRFLSELDNCQLVETESDRDVKKLDTNQTKKTKNKVPSINAHSLQNYLDCPLKYKFLHIDKLSTPDSAELVVGQLMHSIFAFYFNARKENQKLTLSNLQEKLKESWINRGFLSEKNANDFFIECQKQIGNFYDRFSKLPAPDFIEYPFALNLTSTKLSGRMDAIFLDGSELNDHKQPIVVDFKTSDRVTNQEKADEKTKTSQQLTIYALAWREINGVIPQTALYFPSSDLLGVKLSTEKQLENQLTKIEKTVAEIEESQFIATPSDIVCQYCPFKDFCPYSKANSKF